MADFGSIAGEVFQQLKGPLSEVAHETTKLIIEKIDDQDLGTGFGAPGNNDFADAAIGATGLGGVINNAGGASGKKFMLQINPEQYNRTYKIEYSTPRPAGSEEPEPQFSRVAGEQLEISFTLDGTGVVPASIGDLANFGKQMLTKTLGFNDVSFVTNALKKLREVIGKFDKDQHKTPKIKVSWGDVPPFVGRLEQLDVSYTLFHPSGIPLRAEVKLKLIEDPKPPLDPTANQQVATAATSNSSPDITHRRTVKQFDTLPLLTSDVYKDGSYCWQVARFNQLTHFRKLKEQTNLFFPPLDRSNPKT